MGIPIRRAVASVRFSLGSSTTAAEIDQAVEIIPREVARVRAAPGATG